MRLWGATLFWFVSNLDAHTPAGWRNGHADSYGDSDCDRDTNTNRNRTRRHLLCGNGHADIDADLYRYCDGNAYTDTDIDYNAFRDCNAQWIVLCLCQSARAWLL